MSKTKVNCTYCGKIIWRENREINRSKSLCRNIFCNNSCSAKYNNPRFCSGNNDNLKSDNRKDDFTPFRWYMRRIKDRSHKQKTDIDLEYLRELWEQQSGICPITGWNLILRTTTDNRCKQIKDASLDRIDSSKGYIKGNVRFVSCMANIAKNNWSDEDLFDFCQSVVKYRNY